MYYEVIAGSRSYALDIESSDIDLCRVADTWDMGRMDGPYNILQIPKDEFAERITGGRDSVYYLQWLFPHEVRSDNALTQWLQANREQIIAAQLPHVRKILRQTADGLMMYADELYDKFPKWLAYSAHFYSVVADYAAGMPFAQAHVARGDLRDNLLAIRRKQLPVSDALQICQEQQARADAAAWYYERATDLAVLEDVKARVLATE